MPAPKRRTQRSARTTARIAARNAGTGMSATTSGARATTTVTRSGMSATAVADAEEARAGRMMDFQVEMKYINHDLRELLIISVCLFALLFLVGFFI